MRQPVDIGKERRKRQRSHRMRQLSVLLLIVLGIFVALYLNDVLVRKSVTVHIGDMVETVGGSGFPANLPNGVVRNVDQVGKNLVVLKDSNLYAYNPKGKQLMNLQQMKERTVIATNGDRILKYDVGGRGFSLHSVSSLVFEQQMEDNIITADLGENGELAVVTWPANFVAEITVYTRKNEPFYRSLFSENLVSHVALSPKGKQMAVATLGSNQGELAYTVLLYPLDDEKAAPLEMPLENRVVVWMDYLREDTIVVLTDRDYRVYDNLGVELGVYELPKDYELTEFRADKGRMLLLGRDRETRGYELLLLSEMAEELGKISLKYRPVDLDIGEKTVYLLLPEGVEEYDLALEKVADYPQAGVERFYLLGDRLYLLTKNEILIFDKEPVAQEA